MFFFFFFWLLCVIYRVKRAWCGSGKNLDGEDYRIICGMNFKNVSEYVFVCVSLYADVGIVYYLFAFFFLSEQHQPQ